MLTLASASRTGSGVLVADCLAAASPCPNRLAIDSGASAASRAKLAAETAATAASARGLMSSRKTPSPSVAA
jgi:hypothetical protein